MTSEITIYTTRLCVYCFLAKRLLKRLGLAYEEHRYARSADDRKQVAALSGGGLTYPQIVIDGESVGGYTELAKLHRLGRLAENIGS